MQTTFIYALNCPLKPRRAYVGKANDPYQRYEAHLRASGKEKTYKSYWIRSLLAVGMTPVLEVLDEVPIAEWPFWEKEWLRLYKLLGFDLTNGTDGGEGADGRPCSLETRAKIGAGNSGEKSPNFGKPLPVGTRKKISNSLTGIVRSKETRNKMSESRRDIVFSEETRARMSAAKTGIRLPEDTKVKLRDVVRVTNTSGIPGVYYVKQWQNWRVRVTIAGKRTELGSFLTIEEAAEARNRAVLAEGITWQA